MSKIRVVAQASYPVPITGGRHLAPGEFAMTEPSQDVRNLLSAGSLREVPVPEELPSATEETQRKPRAPKARDEIQEDE